MNIVSISQIMRYPPSPWIWLITPFQLNYLNWNRFLPRGWYSLYCCSMKIVLQSKSKACWAVNNHGVHTLKINCYSSIKEINLTRLLSAVLSYMLLRQNTLNIQFTLVCVLIRADEELCHFQTWSHWVILTVLTLYFTKMWIDASIQKVAFIMILL